VVGKDDTYVCLDMHDTNPFISDDDKYGHDFIGEARIPLFHLKPQEPRHMNIYLEKHCPVNISVFRHQLIFISVNV